MKIIQAPAILDGVSPLKDGGMSVRFHTQEMSADQKLLLMDYYQKFGWMMFKQAETAFSEEEVPKYDPEAFDEIKSPSERLRAVMYIYATQVQNVEQERFLEWYRKEMEKVIDLYKAKLPVRTW